MIADLDDEHEQDRWPTFRASARAAGVRSMRAFPITVMNAPVGSVVVHAAEPWGADRLAR